MKLRGLVYLSLGLAVTGCAQPSQVVVPADEVVIEKKAAAQVHKTEKYYLGQVQVMVANDTQLSELMEDMKAKQGLDLQVLDKIPSQPIYLLEVNAATDVPKLVTTLKKDDRVLAASRVKEIALKDFEADAEAKTAAAELSSEEPVFRTNDPLLATQWALNNRGQEAPKSLAGISGADISMGGVDTTGNYEVVVAVLDTGIDYLHEDLAVTEMVDGRMTVMPGSNIWVNPGEIPGNGINDDNNGGDALNFKDDVYGYNFVGRNGDPMDDHGHGTHVAGVIGALRNNFKGIAGMNQKVSMMGLKFLSATGGGSDFDAQSAIYYLIEMAKKYPEKRFILSNSWGSSSRDTQNGDDDDFLLMAFAEAGRANILSTAAAGNDGTSNRFAPHYPSNYSDKVQNLIAVAANNNLDQLASFSCYGHDNVQVSAPGVLIMSTVPQKLFGTGYAAWSGTSMATPHVTGLAALIWANNMEFSANEVKSRILNSADKLPQLFGAVSTSGRINVARALKGDENPQNLKIYREVPKTLESHRGSDTHSYDTMTKITQPGAKEMAVCFSRINLDNDHDWIEIMGADFRVRDTMTGIYKDRNYKGEERELCSAPVLGDTLYIRLYNQGAEGGLQGFKTKYLKVVE
jgi:subtilisin family serine protease